MRRGSNRGEIAKSQKEGCLQTATEYAGGARWQRESPCVLQRMFSRRLRNKEKYHDDPDERAASNMT